MQSYDAVIPVAQQLTGSCATTFDDLVPQQKQEKLFVDTKGTVISEDRQKEMIAYAKKLKTKFPHMKSERIARKVANYFKVKLV